MPYMAVAVLIFAVLLVWFLYIALKPFVYKRFLSPLRHLPGHEPSDPFTGGVLNVLGNNFIERWVKNLEDFQGKPYRFYSIAGEEWVSIYNADEVRHVLSNTSNYVRITNFLGSNLFAAMVGSTSMLLHDGALHKKHKTVCSPAFTAVALKRIIPSIEECSLRLTKYWDSLLGQQGPGSTANGVNVRKDFSQVTLNIIGLAAFGLDFDCIGQRDSALSNSFQDITTVGQQIRVWFALPFARYLPHPIMRNFWKALKNLQAAIAQMIDCYNTSTSIEKNPSINGSSSSSFRGCLLEMIMGEGSGHKESAVLDAQELRDEMMTFLIAGHETSSLALTWVLYLLAKHPDVQEKCRQETETVLEKVQQSPNSWHQLERMKYIEATINESLRLYPPIPSLARRSIAPDDIAGLYVPAKQAIGINIFMMHRNPQHWSEPHVFKPERFLNIGSLPAYFIPFGDGVHKCIGYRMAMMEIQMLLATVVKRYRFSLQNPDEEVDVRSIITLQPLKPILINIQRNSE